MIDISRIFYLLAAVFLLMGLIFNFLSPHMPRIPGDIWIDKPGIKIYIPFTSALIISVILTILLNFFRI